MIDYALVKTYRYDPELLKILLAPLIYKSNGLLKLSDNPL
jgi:hypothetical protein